MKYALIISLLLNLGSLGLLVWLHEAGTKPPVISESGPASVAAAVAPPSSLPADPAPKPFHWSQLDSTNYYTYVKNLRAIDCPVPSLRAIVTADVEAVFGQRRRQLEKALAELDNRPLAAQLHAFASGPAINAELQQLPAQETRLIADFLSGPANPPTQPQLPPLPNGPAVLPLVLQPIDLAGINLDSEQKQTIEDLRQRFITQIGGPAQNPNDPAYLQRWGKAQAETDDLVQALLGNEAWQNMQLQAGADDRPGTSGGP